MTALLKTILPYIFCGILVAALVILYFMNGEVPLRRRRAAAAVLAFYLLTFYISFLTRAMHGGTHTNWFNYRYSFVFCCFLIGLKYSNTAIAVVLMLVACTNMANNLRLIGLNQYLIYAIEGVIDMLAACVLAFHKDVRAHFNDPS